ncbi:hypothetical protein VTO42DRAFT_3522 [Malbranchea cinnamomea]
MQIDTLFYPILALMVSSMCVASAVPRPGPAPAKKGIRCSNRCGPRKNCSNNSSYHFQIESYVGSNCWYCCLEGDFPDALPFPPIGSH